MFTVQYVNGSRGKTIVVFFTGIFVCRGLATPSIFHYISHYTSNNGLAWPHYDSLRRCRGIPSAAEFNKHFQNSRMYLAKLQYTDLLYSIRVKY